MRTWEDFKKDAKELNTTTKEDIDYVVDSLKNIVTKLRELSPINEKKGW